MANTDKLPTLSANQLKVGDTLIREADHLGRPDHRITIKAKKAYGRMQFQCEGYWSTGWETGTRLCSQNYSIVERAGQRIGRFFQRYW